MPASSQGFPAPTDGSDNDFSLPKGTEVTNLTAQNHCTYDGLNAASSVQLSSTGGRIYAYIGAVVAIGLLALGWNTWQMPQHHQTSNLLHTSTMAPVVTPGKGPSTTSMRASAPVAGTIRQTPHFATYAVPQIRRAQSLSSSASQASSSTLTAQHVSSSFSTDAEFYSEVDPIIADDVELYKTSLPHYSIIVLIALIGYTLYFLWHALTQTKPLKPKLAMFSVAALPAGGAADNSEPEPAEGPSTSPKVIWSRFRAIAAPYWSTKTNPHAGKAWLALLAVLILTVTSTGIRVWFSFLARDLMNYISAKDGVSFWKHIVVYMAAIAVAAPIQVYKQYLTSRMELAWRSWLTSDLMQRYLHGRNFYTVQTQGLLDNPDQRIEDDVEDFTACAVRFSLSIFDGSLQLVAYTSILYSIYPPLLFLVICYSIGGTFVSLRLGRSLVPLDFTQEKKEADFRFALVRLRENAESVAFYGGEKSEGAYLKRLFGGVADNLEKVFATTRNLAYFQVTYKYIVFLIPAIIISPLYFNGVVEFGAISQSNSAFNVLLTLLSGIVFGFSAIARFSASIDRLGEMYEVLRYNVGANNPVQAGTSEGDAVAASAGEPATKIDMADNVEAISELPTSQIEIIDSTTVDSLLDIKGLTLAIPDGSRTLIADLSLSIKEGESVLVMGPSGCGKTSLLRAIAGIWTTGSGQITRQVADPDRLYEDIFFLPQTPYMVIGNLRDQLLFPTWVEGNNNPKIAPTDEQLVEVLEQVNLASLLDRPSSKRTRCGLDGSMEWGTVLSMGERQRLAFARLLLNKPKLAVLDESTSAMDIETQAMLYEKVQQAGITYVSIGHRSGIKQWHTHLLTLGVGDPPMGWIYRIDMSEPLEPYATNLRPLSVHQWDGNTPVSSPIPWQKLPDGLRSKAPSASYTKWSPLETPDEREGGNGMELTGERYINGVQVLRMGNTVPVMQGNPSAYVPILSLESFVRGRSADSKVHRELVWAVEKAMTSSGFCIITGHGIPDSVFTNAGRVMREFFHLPEEEKDKIANQFKGFVGVGKSGNQVRPTALSEKWSCGRVSGVDPNDTYYQHGRYFGHPNLFPAEPKDFESAMTTYYTAMETLTLELLSLMATALGLPHRTFDEPMKHHVTNLVALRYPPQKTPPREGTLRALPHTDPTALTILHYPREPGPESGLEVRHMVTGVEQWDPVPVVAGGLVVNVGDLLCRWTNGRLRSSQHRVVNGTDDRLALSYFATPGYDVEVKPLHGTVSPGTQPVYPPIIVGDQTHFAQLKKEEDDGDATDPQLL